MRRIALVLLPAVLVTLAGCAVLLPPDANTECPLTSAEIDELLPGNSGEWTFTPSDSSPGCSIIVDGSDDYWYGGTYWINWTPSIGLEERASGYEILGTRTDRPDVLIWGTDYSDRIEIGFLGDADGVAVQLGYRGPLRGPFSTTTGDGGDALAALATLYDAAEASGWRGISD